jgi:hypothetical protein
MTARQTVTDAASSTLFSPRVLVGIIAIGIMAFVGVLYISIFGGNGDPDVEVGPNSYSSSAIGHRGLMETLRRLDIPVVISRYDSGNKANKGSLLVLAEPDGTRTSADRLGGFRNAPNGLLVLPKWDGTADRRKPRWVGEMEKLPLSEVVEVLDRAEIGGKVTRLEGAKTINAAVLGGQIEFTDLQVITGSSLKPILALKEGIVIGELNAPGQQWVLSDPDLISNHGLDESDNALVAVTMIERLRPSGGVVVFDETIHGFESRPNLVKAAFDLPFVMVTISGAIALALSVWAGMTRFGRPEPAGRALQPGKVTLIRTTADLLHQANRRSGAVQLVLTRYLRAQIADMLARLNAPRGLDERRQVMWLDDIAETRRITRRLHPTAEAVETMARSGNLDPAKALRIAIDLHAWKQEFLNGLGKSSVDR